MPQLNLRDEPDGTTTGEGKRDTRSELRSRPLAPVLRRCLCIDRAHGGHQHSNAALPGVCTRLRFFSAGRHADIRHVRCRADAVAAGLWAAVRRRWSPPVAALCRGRECSWRRGLRVCHQYGLLVSGARDPGAGRGGRSGRRCRGTGRRGAQWQQPARRAGRLHRHRGRHGAWTTARRRPGPIRAPADPTGLRRRDAPATHGVRRRAPLVAARCLARRPLAAHSSFRATHHPARLCRRGQHGVPGLGRCRAVPRPHAWLRHPAHQSFQPGADGREASWR